jgi:hypothetical protein
MRKLVLGSLVLALAGCGSSSPDEQTLTAAEWRREANTICREIGREVRAVPEPRTVEAILPFTAAVIPLWKRQEDGIRALVPPSELAADAEALVDALAELNVALLEIHIATQRNDDGRQADGIQREVTATQSIRRWSNDLRLHVCLDQRIP